MTRDYQPDAYWLPFTANRAYQNAGLPRQLIAAKDMHYVAENGQKILDGTSGMWCVNAGHARAKIVEAISKQAGVLDYAASYQFSHPLAFQLADKLKALLPGFENTFFTNSGSEAIDTALKIALAYHVARGQPQRKFFISRERAFHGVNFGGTSVSGIAHNRRPFSANLLPHVAHLPSTHDIQRNAFSKGQPAFGAEFADALEAQVQQHGAENIAAVIVEPMAGATGVLVPPVGYLERLRNLCDKHGILLIFDEVITGFGRTGAPFATQKFKVQPDIICLAKGLTNGAVPMGAAVVRKQIHDAIINAAPNNTIEFPHGHTYSGHPLACAAALATLELYAEEKLFERSAELAPYFEDAVHSLRGKAGVLDIRNIGLAAGIELEHKQGETPTRAFRVFEKCFEKGLLIRVTGDIIALSPPFIVSKAQIDEIVGILAGVLKT